MNHVNYLKHYITRVISSTHIFVLQIKTKKTMKNLTELNGNWNEVKGKLKQKFALLTDNDVLLVKGKEDEMLGRLQVRLGKTKEEVRKLISEL